MENLRARLDHWRSERLRLLSEIAADPKDARGLKAELEADLEQAESFMRYYEDRLAKKRA